MEITDIMTLYGLTDNGLIVPTYSELVDYLSNSLKQIYGNDIDLEQNTPDGQLVNILAQIWYTVNTALLQITTTFNVNDASGRTLDNLVALHSIKRKAGTFTQVPIEINTDRVVELKGVDDNYYNENATGFTVADNVGNQYILINSSTLQKGANTVAFRAQNMGDIRPVLNTITNIITPQLGVISVNNGGIPTQVGVLEEADITLRNRYNSSEAITGRGELDNVVSNLLQLEGVTTVYGDENKTNITNKYGTPPHSIWLIIEGGGNYDIATVINSTISAGCGLKGEVVVPYVNIFGNTEDIKFDRPTFEDLYLKLQAQPMNNQVEVNVEEIKEYIVNNLEIRINSIINSNQITCLLKSYNSSILWEDIELSKDNENWDNIISNTNINYIFSLITSNINIEVEPYNDD